MDGILRALHPKSAQFLLWKVFIRDNRRGVILWLAVGFDVSEMPSAMLFIGHEMGFISKFYIHERMQCSFDSFMFLPELVECGKNVDPSYSQFCTDEIVRAVRIVRSRCTLGTSTPDNSRQKQQQLQNTRIKAAILVDDTAWLGALAAEPVFCFSTGQLAYAARHGSIECFRFLSINGAVYSQQVVEAAAFGGHEEVIQMCLEHDCKVNTKEVMEESIRGCQMKIVEWLVDVHGMKPTADDVVAALFSGNFDFVVQFESSLFEATQITFHQPDKFFIQRNNDVRHFIEYVLNKSDTLRPDPFTVLYCDDPELARKCGVRIASLPHVLFAAMYDCHTILRAVSSMGMIDVTNRFGRTALMRCAGDGFPNALVSLVRHGANVDAVDSLGMNALMRAAQHGCTRIVKVLIEFGARINVADNAGKTALMHAAINGQTDTVKYLAEHGVPIGAVDQSGKTALMHAACREHTDIVSYLSDAAKN